MDGIGGYNPGLVPPDLIVVQRHLLVPEFDRALCQDPVVDTNSTASSAWPQDMTATGAIPTKRKSTLSFRWGHNNTGQDLNVAAIVQSIASTAAVVAIGTLKSRFAIFPLDAPWETSDSLKGIPNSGAEGAAFTMFSTGTGITFNAARSAFSAATGGGILPANLRYDISGGLGVIPAGAGFCIARLDEVAYVNAGITPSPEAPTSGIFQTSQRGPFGVSRQNRLNSGQYNRRPCIYINGLLGDGTSVGIDDIDWNGATSMNGKPIGNWTSFTDGQLQGTTHISGVSSGLMTGSTVALTSGVTIRNSLVWAPITLLCNPVA